MKLLWFAIAGGIGTLSRYWFGGLVQRALGGTFPLGTFAVNMAGCLLFGLIWTLAEERLVISGETRAIVLIGFMGAFTTFSSFIFESGALLRDGEWTYAIANIVLQNILGLVFLFIGIFIGKTI